MRNAHVDPAAVDAAAVGFRLAPRINAAGRLGRPDAALELLLTTDAGEAKRLADELETLNRDRQAVEERILRAAIAEVESWPEPRRRRRGYVIWGEDWHEGVIGIVASRLVERFNRPVVLIAGTEKEWKGSGRSLPAFDLHGALAACSSHLHRFGGHRAAAGLSIDPANLEAFAAAFAAHADAELVEDDLAPGDPDRRDRARLGAHARPGDGARAPGAVRARQSGRDAARRRLRGGAAGCRGGGQAPALPHPPAAAATPARRSPSASARSSTECGGPFATTSPAG